MRPTLIKWKNPWPQLNSKFYIKKHALSVPWSTIPFFTHYYKQQQILPLWKTSLNILLYKKDDPTKLTNHRPIALANTIYKLFTNSLTTIMSTYGEKYQILHNSQEVCYSQCAVHIVVGPCAKRHFIHAGSSNPEFFYLLLLPFFEEGFWSKRGTSRHLQLLITGLEDAKCDPSYPIDVVSLVGNIYSHSPTIFSSNSFGKNSTNKHTTRHNPKRYTQPLSISCLPKSPS